ncbi:MAG: hypothetical protein D4R73_09505 [Deltaproteobacteria bacterium]|nr:MAG: hypothetical protein D4R73_09505 [Deltaproteobacteria bacterium]
MRRTLCWILILGLVISLGIVGCAKKEEANEIKIGAILPLTGTASLLGTETKEGIDIAVEEINTNNIINGRKIGIVYQDSMNDPKEGISAFQALMKTNRPNAVIVSMSSVTKAVIPVANQRKIVVFATVTAAPRITELSPWAFRYYYTTDIQAEELAKFMVEKLHLKNVGVLHLDDDYGVTGYEALKKELEKRGVNVVTSESYSKSDLDVKTQIVKIKSANPEGITIIAYDNSLALAIKQIKELGINAKLFSYSGLADPKVLQLTGNAADGVYVTVSNYDPENPITQKQKEFVGKYKKKFGKLPGHYPAFGYDALMCIAEAINASGDSPDEIRQGLLTIKNVDFVLGQSTMAANREVKFDQVIRVAKGGRMIHAN